MNELQIFNNKKFGKVRVLEIDKESYFVGKDVATILGYNNPRDAIRKHIDREDKGVAKCDTLGGIQELTIINESGLYSLILSSKLPQAKEFKRWVTSEVLPSIRKHGMYAKDELLDNPDLLIQVATKLKEEREKTKLLEQKIEQDKPKVEYHDTVLQSTSLIPVSLIAKDYGMSAVAFNKMLEKNKIQYKQSGTWLLYSKYQDKGYTYSKTSEYTKHNGEIGTSIHTYWTEQGRLFLYEFLKSKNILPVSESELIYV